MNKRLSTILRESIESVLNEEWTSDGKWHFSPEFKNATYDGPDLEEMGILPTGTHPYEYPHPSGSYNPIFHYKNPQDDSEFDMQLFDDGEVINKKLDSDDKDYRFSVWRGIDDFMLDNPDLTNPETWEGVEDSDMYPFYRYTNNVPLSKLRKKEAQELKAQGKDSKKVPSVGVRDPYSRWNDQQTALEYRRMYPEYMDTNV